jgi:hypothetical protein
MALTSPASGPEVTNEWSFTSLVAAFEGFRVQICTSHPEVLGDFIILSKQMSGFSPSNKVMTSSFHILYRSMPNNNRIIQRRERRTVDTVT